MPSFRSLAAAALAAVAPAVAAPVALAQVFGTLAQDDAAGVYDLAALAAGGAVVAAPTLDSPFFSNPAHLAATPRLRLTVLGLGVNAGGNVRETYTFVQDELRPALDEGIDEIRQNDPDRLQALYDEAFRVGRSQKTAGANGFFPSFVAPAGPVAVGAGVFGTSTVRARIGDAGAGIPFVDTYAQADLLVPVGVGHRFALPGLPFGVDVGATATYVQRRVTAIADPLDAFDADSEKVYLLSGSGVRLSAGVMARNVGLRGLDAGLSLTNIGGAIPLAFDRSMAIVGSDSAPDDAAEIARLEARFNDRSPAAEMRVGAAYRAPRVPGLSDALVTADYTTRSTSEFEQSVQAGLRLGARATVAGALALRVGVSQGMPSAGVGVQSKLARFEVATYGVEDGRLLGQQRRRNVVAQLRLGWF